MKEEVWNKIARYCALSERCKADVTDKLTEAGLLLPDINEILRRLEEELFIDEGRYSRAYVNDKYRFVKWGRLKIRQHLRLKKIPDTLINQALNGIDRELYMSGLHDLLSGKRKGFKAKNEFERGVKLVRFAISRGFEYGEIKEVLTGLGEHAEEDLWEESE